MTRLTQAVKQCTKCSELSSTRTQPVLGDGPVPCDIVFLGESPGFHEDQSGIPFCGPSGKLLEALARSVGLQRKVDYHILNVLKCRPPNNRDPYPKEVENCTPYLVQQLRVIQPKVVLALGKYAQAVLLGVPGNAIGVVQNMGHVYRHPDFYVVLSCHPRFTSSDAEIVRAFKLHIKLAKHIAKRKGEPKCTARNALFHSTTTPTKN